MCLCVLTRRRLAACRPGSRGSGDHCCADECVWVLTLVERLAWALCFAPPLCLVVLPAARGLSGRGGWLATREPFGCPYRTCAVFGRRARSLGTDIEMLSMLSNNVRLLPKRSPPPPPRLGAPARAARAKSEFTPISR